MGRMLDKLDRIDGKVDDLKYDLAELPEKIFEKADERYAPKEAWLAVKFVIGVCALAIIGAILRQVLTQ